MFSLIITVISIALVAALAISTLYFGGSAFGEGTTEAEVSTLINQGTQIDAARQLYRVKEGSDAGDINDLVSEYLASVPTFEGVAWQYEGGDEHFVELSGVDSDAAQALCDEVGDDSGLYECDDDNERFEFGG